MIYKEASNEMGTLKVEYDQSSESPREDRDNLGKMVCFHKRYSIGDAHNNKSSDFSGWGEFATSIRNGYGRDGVALILPIYLYDHSGITISTEPFSCRWDSGQIGFIFATKEDVRRRYNVKNVTAKVVEKVRKALLSEVEEMDQYLQGDIYGFTIEDKEGNMVDSCWGFYGESGIKSMQEYIPEEYTELLRGILTN